MPALRRLRGTVVGLSASGLGIAGHAVAGSMLPPMGVSVVATGGLVLLGIAMSGRTWSLPPLLGVLVGAQVALHVALADGTAMQGHMMLGHVTHGRPAGMAMAAAHLAAAALTAALLQRGEQWCQSLVELLRRPLLGIHLAVVPPPRPRPLPVGHVASAGTGILTDSSLSRRGPPRPSLP